jgi:signal transduction histidine kinase
MHIALMNLVENAIKFTPDGGRIRLRVGEEDASVHIAVEDSGIGIEKEELERIFDKFYTSRDPLHHTSGTYQFRARGSGLGLSIAKGYVEAHGGRIWAESEGAGKGSAFHVVLPRAGADA